VRADIEVIGCASGVAYLAADLLLGTAAAFVERLHPQRFRNVSNRFREPMECGRTGIESRGQAFPPGIEQRVNRVRGAAADFLADPFNRRALPLAQERIGGELDVASGDTAGGRSIVKDRCGRFRHAQYNTVYVCALLFYGNDCDNDSYRHQC
jgi:hypothetical protein